MSNIENKTIICQDGYSLAANFYKAEIETDKLPVLLCPATGIIKEFYQSFALWLCKQGYDVLCFDFRGIGQSLHGKLKDSTASIQDWGQLDIPAAIDMLLTLTQKDQVILVGHSAGGQLLGIVPNYQKVAKVLAVSGSSGHKKGLKGRTKILAPVMFKVIFPIARVIKGYGPTKAVGMGENLPKDVAKQWAQFCNKPGYIANAIGKTVFEDFHQDIHCPITAIWSSDDEIATEVNVKDLLRLYPNATTSMFELNPEKLGHKAIGHMLMFRKSHQDIWPLLEQHIAA
ncbi:alpha/beta fold hydrolase [Acinetobacter gerneri]|uniref:Alpha/beta fold hydrolase n=1 Tax=Acinetobacter gerneri TaxID=202952 RepID=A0AAW8JE46_9GAMM|nr:alpha/beta fold hydrolase [Acinetobacter gerneri]MDQ9008292.1 alpha/beta fold hydrolase [Acinetobacter gerneri]MDQ9012294.1 alpha/beta fold hydrolase [Acinetobacter gerneri]MDQ9023831.1 alpha/beta fold hydrolase [Acinetobacter gerneri]MDQ9051207.1 alpha/beta fold hydrolase [Acinetobacter gerneri]MDQ9058934.1 alpha/beta fold hydrolase [Acinetobacter gerneri]